jgi:Holliday junction resolvasome RuvABC endonuclease subunit
MLHLPDDPTPYRIVGIDPGTDTLGVSVLDLDLADGSISLVTSQTFHGSKLIRGYQEMEETMGARFARLHVLEQLLVDAFHEEQPHSIISESPYFNSRRPQAYGALVEAMAMIGRAVYRYHSRMPLLTVDPASNKANLKVSGKSGDKELMKAAVLKQADILNPHHIDLAQLDEHSIDSASVGYYRACQVRAMLKL